MSEGHKGGRLYQHFFENLENYSIIEIKATWSLLGSVSAGLGLNTKRNSFSSSDQVDRGKRYWKA